MPESIVWKKEEILSQLSGDTTFLKELVGDLTVLLKESQEGLELALNQGDMAKASAISHTLKGSSGNLAAHEIYQISKDLEMDCKAGGSHSREIFATLVEGINRLEAELKAQGYLD